MMMPPADGGQLGAAFAAAQRDCQVGPARVVAL
jgi:hypothetical protein